MYQKDEEEYRRQTQEFLIKWTVIIGISVIAIIVWTMI
jgi:hypothetical protein